MHATIGHYRNVPRFGSHLGVPAGEPKFHAFIGMPRPIIATGRGLVDINPQSHEFYYPNNINNLHEGNQTATGKQGNFPRELQSGGTR